MIKKKKIIQIKVKGANRFSKTLKISLKILLILKKIKI